MKTPIIRSLILQRFRSVPAARLELDNPTFLAGANGSGKSNLVDALAFLAEAMASPLESVFERRGGPSLVFHHAPGATRPSDLGLAVVFGPLAGHAVGGRYGFEVRLGPHHGLEVLRETCTLDLGGGEQCWFDRRRTAFRSNVEGLRPALAPAALGLPVIAGDARFAPALSALAAIQVHSIEPARLRQRQDANGGRRLRRHGGNCAGVLREIGEEAPEDLSRIGEILATIVPGAEGLRIREHGGELALELSQRWQPGEDALRWEAGSLSDGTLRAIGLLAAVYQRPVPSLLVIEEPEATIHASAVAAVLDLLRHAARTMQVLVTTHSPEILDGEWIDDRHLRIVEWRRGATGVHEVSAVTRRALREHVMGAGELLRSNALEAAPATGDRPRLFEDGG